MYLVDTNVFLEIFLNQEKANEAEEFLTKTPTEYSHISDFSLYSIGIILSRQKKYAVFSDFVEDVLLEGGVTLLRLSPFDLGSVINAAERFNLDFDDAYQYTLARKYNLKIVSFDSDFDKTDIGRLLPAQALRR
ncbi:PIN domain-containing protein [Pyrococcus abyssi]|uniref:Predicted nucleic acid-binding protein, contains PIN domain n=1 Tax=Pyrococcus abyssi (strain GE5 / Orsay) TaxID=272844 RepID=Q9UZH0_PYRAB|nr:type II toxin-antitoxin system VapC family toxin [Pyrococcus abyssi]CAB50089.1 Predicted nucleic acid-binding protein, contains PIN domain [Pyrococcus abyssi GE5]CCE70604.1 TPA: hypothetical protein PAB0786 [Pyrococcus abyssi GE5]